MISEKEWSIFEKVVKYASIEELDENYLMDNESYSNLIQHISTLESNQFSNTKEQGECLEKLINTVITSTNIFETKLNLKTHNNEIDIRAEYSPAARKVAERYNLNTDKPVYFECKNYKTNIGVTWVGKFASLLRTANNEIGVIVSPTGLTGSGWKDGMGLCKKVALKENINIISITYCDLKKLNEMSLFSLIKNKLEVLIEDFDYNVYIERHHLEDNNDFIG
ncbi:restriction endonuclease [Staphylococcus roterodami]|nr:restriction endonuclease [Staphylococcus roterodami]